jgi:hypothetical protein
MINIIKINMDNSLTDIDNSLINMANALTNALTGEKLEFTWGVGSGDNKSYIMFPDHTKILCQLINDSGIFIKADGSFGEELVWCKVCDQRCFRSDILYWVIPLSKISDGEYDVMNGASTRASLIINPSSKLSEEDGKKMVDYCKLALLKEALGTDRKKVNEQSQKLWNLQNKFIFGRYS